MDFGGNAGLFLGVCLSCVAGLQFAFFWVWGRVEAGVKDGFGICD